MRARVIIGAAVILGMGCDAYNPVRPDVRPSDSTASIASVTVTSHVECGATITASVTLDADLNCAEAPGLIIDADDVILDGNGRTISGPGCEDGVCRTPNHAGIWVKPRHRRATIRNLRVTGFGSGILLVDVTPGLGHCNVLAGSALSEHVIVGNTFNGNVGAGVALSCSHGNQVLNNNISDNGGGIDVSGTRSGGNFIVGNRAERNRSAGLLLLFAPGNVVTRNTFSSNSSGILALGFEPAAPSDNVFEENFIESNGRGIEIRGDRSRISRNRVAGSAGDGIEIGGSSNIIENNLILSNGAHGLAVGGGQNNVIRDNTISGNGFLPSAFEAGIQLGSHSSEVVGNTLSDNEIGIRTGASQNRIHDNMVSGSRIFGLWLQSATDNVIFHNDIIGNNPTGISIGRFAGQVYDDNLGLNHWHEPTLLEGNFWSDYAGVDDGSGTDKHAVAGDGIGDTRIPHPEAGFDFYPFVDSGGWRVRVVAIDIKPGSFPNSINLSSAGTVPVAILSDVEFDARSIDPATVTLASAAVKFRRNGTAMAAPEDVNGDGLLDLVVHFDTEALELTETDTEAVLLGRTIDGRRVRSSDSVDIVP